MVDESAFVAKITENPDNPDSWLIYCDWLEEQGRHEEAEVYRAAEGKGLPCMLFFYLNKPSRLGRRMSPAAMKEAIAAINKPVVAPAWVARRGRASVEEIAERYGVHPDQITALPEPPPERATPESVAGAGLRSPAE